MIIIDLTVIFTFQTLIPSINWNSSYILWGTVGTWM